MGAGAVVREFVDQVEVIRRLAHAGGVSGGQRGRWVGLCCVGQGADGVHSRPLAPQHHRITMLARARRRGTT